MGYRSNLIIINKGVMEYYTNRWCGSLLDEYLFWGIEPATVFFKYHEKESDKFLYDTVDCEGGAVIDMDKKDLL